MKRAWPLLLLLTLGCSSRDYSDWMPMAPGNQWAYEANLHLKTSVAEVKVTEAVPVGDVKGWLLKSDYGVTRLAWSGEELIASELAGVRFFPPLTSLRPAKDDQEWTWKGTVLHAGSRTSATANIKQENNKLNVGGRERDCLKVTIDLEIDGWSPMTLRTWYARNLGIVRQDLNHPDRDPVPSLTYVSGPN